jgi:hypothetical protein
MRVSYGAGRASLLIVSAMKGRRFSRSRLWQRARDPLLAMVLAFAIGGFSWLSFLVGLLGGAAMALGPWREGRIRRPYRSYAWLALASAFIFMLFVVEMILIGGDWRLGGIAWLAITALGGVWVRFYERTEPPET